MGSGTTPGGYGSRLPAAKLLASILAGVSNIYFELTEVFNAGQRNVVLASGQAVVFYRIAIMSKDGDWIIRETPEACGRVLSELERRGARYRVAAPLDVRWLSGGWSSHFEFEDDRGRRVRCDFVSRPPRVPAREIGELFNAPAVAGQPLSVVSVESLILMKQTQRAKDYPVIAELAELLPPVREIELTTNPDRILELAPLVAEPSERPAARAARAGEGRAAVVRALAEEMDAHQQQDRRRVARYEEASRDYFEQCRRAGLTGLMLSDAHRLACELAERWLPRSVSDSL